jgi:hypothetical protein
MKIINTEKLKVKQIEKNQYLTSITGSRILFTPKVCYKLDNNGKLINIKVYDFIKSIILNLFFFLGIFILFIYINEQSLENLIDFAPLFVGLILFLIVINYIIINSTKREVNKQIE